MKRILAVLLAAITLLTPIASFTGCSKSNKEVLEVGQWLGMINNTFGMESYTKEESYVSSVSKNDEYFKTVQIAAEWGVINAKEACNPHEQLLWKTALITLVNAGEFLSSDVSEKEKIEFAVQNFDNSIREYWMDREIDIENASKLLSKAKNCWANKTYDKSIQNVKYTEDVIDLSKNQDNIVDYNPADGVLEIKTKETDKKIQKDDVIIAPLSNGSAKIQAYKAEEVTEKNGVTYIKTNKDLELGDFVDELYIEDTYEPDFTTAEIYDGNGNLVQKGASAASSQAYYKNNEITMSHLVANSNNSFNATPMAEKTTYTFETDSCKVQVTIKKNGLSAEIEVPMSENVKGFYKAEVSDFQVTNKIDYSWFTLHSAEVKVDYTTKNTVGVKKQFTKKEAVYAPKWSNGNGKFLTNLKKSVWKNKNDGIGAKKIKLGSIKVASVGVASFSVDIYAKIKVDGSVEVTCSETGSKGIEYKNGNCRLINTSVKNNDVKVKCKAEATVSVGPTVNAFGFAIIGLNAEAGLGAEASTTLHLADPDNHLLEEATSDDISPEVYEETSLTGLTGDAEEIKKLAESQGGNYEPGTSTVKLHMDICIDINVYFILKVGVEEETLVGKLLKDTKITVQWDICNSKNAKIGNLHVENFDFAKAFGNIAFFTDEDQCTMKYNPFDGEEKKAADTTEENQANSSVEVGEVLTISTMNVVLEPNQSAVISVTQVPKGYELKDVICKSKNTDIATIDINGVITAKSEGNATVIVATSDGKYSCACTVTVVHEYLKDFTPLKYWNNHDMEALAA